MLNLANDSARHSIYQRLEEKTSLFIATSGRFDKWEREGVRLSLNTAVCHSLLERLDLIAVVVGLD